MIKKKVFNKLVRDNIPQILENKNIKCSTHILNKSEFSRELNNKLKEEVEEFLDAKDKIKKIEELADILEVINTLVQDMQISFDELEKIRLKKRSINGGFSKKIFLEKIDVSRS